MGKMERKTAEKLVLSLLTGILLSFGLSIVALMGYAIFILSGGTGQGGSSAVGMVLCFFSVFAGALVAVKRCAKHVLPVGASVGMGCFGGLLLVSVFSGACGELGLSALPLLLVCLCAGGLAGSLGTKRKKRRN